MQSHKKTLTLTNIIILLTIFMYLFQMNYINGTLILGLNVSFLEEKRYYQALSTIFAHGSYEHLIMNMIVLWQFGNLLEHNIGKYKFLFLYIVGGILTSIGTIFYMSYFEQYSNVVGASGAISVLFGYIALKYKEQRNVMIIFILLISFVPLLFGFSVAWYTHLIGFIIGFITSYII